jgi:hypothetical protein
MDSLWKHIAHSCLVLLFLLAAGQSTTKMKEKCGTCRDITEAFAKVKKMVLIVFLTDFLNSGPALCFEHV